MIDLNDLIQNIEKLTTNNESFKILKDFERVLDDLDLYVFKNWENGELVQGPEVHRHTVSCTFLWKEKDMPDPVGATRLLDYGCKVYFKKDIMLYPRKIKSEDDFRPGTKKGKIDKESVWLVNITIPKKLMQDIYQGKRRQDSKFVKDKISINPNDAIDPNATAQESVPGQPAVPQGAQQ